MEDLREKLEGLVESWRDAAANYRSEGTSASVAMAIAASECADDLEAVLATH